MTGWVDYSLHRLVNEKLIGDDLKAKKEDLKLFFEFINYKEKSLDIESRTEIFTKIKEYIAQRYDEGQMAVERLKEVLQDLEMSTGPCKQIIDEYKIHQEKIATERNAKYNIVRPKVKKHVSFAEQLVLEEPRFSSVQQSIN